MTQTSSTRRKTLTPILIILVVAVMLTPVLPVSALTLPTTNEAIATPLSASTTPITGSSAWYFEPNHGQFDPAVSFVARFGGATTFFTPTAVVTALSAPAPIADSAGMDPLVPDGFLPSMDGVAVWMRFEDANVQPIILGQGLVPGLSNYFRGNDPMQWVTAVPHYVQVRYMDLWPGIDLVYYANKNGQLEHDFVLAPGADPNWIRLAFEGADDVRQDEAGRLVLVTRVADLVFEPPFAYQDDDGQSRPVATHYKVLENHHLAYDAGPYDPARTLTIDPIQVLSYSTYLGANVYEEAEAITLDASNNSYVTGWTVSTNFPTTAGAFQTSFAGGYRDAFVSKINPQGTALVYTTYLGGAGTDHPADIHVDGNGNAYVAGQTDSLNYPTTTGAYQTASRGESDLFVTKLNPTGTGLVYSTLLGGSDTDDTRFGEVNALAVDGDGNAFLTGSTSSIDYPVTVGAFQAANQPGYDAFVTKLNAAGTSLVYSTYLGGSSWDEGYAITVNSNGNVYVVGQTNSANFPTTTGAFQTARADTSRDAFVTKLNTDGTQLVYSSYLGGANGTEKPHAVAVDANGNAIVIGYTYSPSFPVTAGAFQTTAAGNQEGFLVRVNHNGTALLNATYLGGGDRDVPRDMALHSDGTIVVVGWTKSSNFPTTANAYQTTPGAADGFVMKFNATASGLVHSTLLGGSSSDEYLFGVTLNPQGDIFIAGRSSSSNFPTTPGVLKPTYGPSLDAVVVRILETDDVAAPTSTGAPITMAWGATSPSLSGVCVQDAAGGLKNAATYWVGTTPGANDLAPSTLLPSQPQLWQTWAWCPAFQVPATVLQQGSNYVTIRVEDRMGFALTVNAYEIRYDNVTESLTGLVARAACGGTALPDGVWQSDNTPCFEWTAPTSTSPVVGYDVSLSTSLSASPGTTVDVTSPTYMSAALSDGTWYFKTRAKDAAGNWGPIAGPVTLKVDATSPSTPAASSPTHEDSDQFYNRTTFTAQWGSTDAASGLDGYSYDLVNGANPPALDSVKDVEETVTTASFSNLGPFGVQTFRVKAGDNAGNWGPVSSRTVRVDAVKPEIWQAQPPDGLPTMNPKQFVRADYKDDDSLLDPEQVTSVDVSTVKLFIDGVDIRMQWQGLCGPAGPLYPTGCRLDVDSSHILFEPLVPWREGPHDVFLTLKDTVVDANTASTSWRFSLSAAMPVDADGDHVPDAVESEVCGRQATRTIINTPSFPGDCATTMDYAPPNAATNLFIPTNVLIGPDGDGDGVPGRVTLQGITLTLDPFSPGLANMGPAPDQVQTVDLNDADPNTPVASVVTAPVPVPIGFEPGPDTDGDGVPATIRVIRANATFDRRNPLDPVTLDLAPDLVLTADSSDTDPNTPVASVVQAPVPVPVNLVFGPDGDQDQVPSEARLQRVFVTVDRRNPGNPITTTPAMDQVTQLDPDDANPNNPAQNTFGPVSIPQEAHDDGDYDNDYVPHSVTVTFLDVTVDRSQTPPLALGAHTNTTILDSDDASRDDPVPFDAFDGDGDLVPDAVEPAICFVQNENSPDDGRCVQTDGTGSDGSGSNYVPPVGVPNPWNLA